MKKQTKRTKPKKRRYKKPTKSMVATAALLLACDEVELSWERGDLAGAVRNLLAVRDQVRGVS